MKFYFLIPQKNNIKKYHPWNNNLFNVKFFYNREKLILIKTFQFYKTLKTLNLYI